MRRPPVLPVAGGLLFVALALLNVSNVGFHALASHVLGPAGYGALGSLLAALVAVSVPFTALQVSLTAEASRRWERGQPVAGGPLAVRFAGCGVLAAAALAAVSPLVDGYLHLRSPATVLWLGGYLVAMSLGVVPWACLCGRRRFAAVALAVLGSALARLGLGALALRAGWGVSGAAAATCAGEAVLAATLLLAARHELRGRAEHRLRLDSGGAVAGVGALAGVAVLGGLDSILARHYLAPAAAGAYVAAAMAARGVVLLASAVTAAALPALSSGDPARAGRARRAAIAGTAALGAGATAVLALAGGWLLPLVFGSGFHSGRPVVVALAAAATAAGVLGTLVQQRIAQRQAGAGAAWVGVVALAIAAAAWHPSALALAAITLAAVSAALVAALALRPSAAPVDVRPSMARPAAGLQPQPDLTVVVPFHNPGAFLRSNVVSLLAALDRLEMTYELVAVADGCTDGSPESIADLGGPVRHVALHPRRGKGEALRAGLREGRGRYLGFIDSDGDLDPSLWEPFLALVRLYRPDAVIGSKRHPLSVIEAPLGRRICSWGYQRLVRLLFGLPVRDSQVGIKVFRRELLADVLPRTVQRGFVFDVEVLAVARRLGYRRLMEAPVQLRYGQVSTVRVATAARMLLQTLAVAWRLRVLRAYDVAPAPAPAVAPSDAVPAIAAPLALEGSLR